MNNFIQSIIDEIKRHFSSSKIQTTKKWSYLIPLIVVCLLGIIGEYVLLLPIHYQSQTFNNKDNSSKDKSVAPEANACPPPRYLFAISLTGICLDLIETCERFKSECFYPKSLY